MDWYRKLRPELTGVVTGDFTKEGRVVSIVIPIQQNYLNVYRVLVQNTGYKTASCEIYNGKLDDGWTRIHAKRGGWID